MSTKAYPKNRRQKRGKNEAAIAGLVLAIIGSIIASSFEKNSLTNYAGFGMLLAGIAAFVVGACSMASANVENRIRRDIPNMCRQNRGIAVCRSIWLIGAGVILGVIGSILANTFEKESIINLAGFGMLLLGIAVFMVGISATALGIVRIELNQKTQSRTKVPMPKIMIFDIIAICIGAVFLITGYILAGSFEKESLMNYTGFSVLILGVAILCLGASGTIVAILKFRLNLNELGAGAKTGIILGGIWAMGIGAMLLINGSLIASSYEKNSIMNNAGFAMLLAGTGVFVYGMFETARISAMGLLSNKNNINLLHKRAASKKNQQETRSSRLKSTLKTLVTTSAILNLSGVIAAVCVLFFSLWQLDIIVSGPVWWAYSPDGPGWSWAGPGPYADEYFQCFLWKTTIGQAYDTLFMLVFISFIVMFASAYFWPKRSRFDANLMPKLRGEDDEDYTPRAKPKHRLPAENQIQDDEEGEEQYPPPPPPPPET